MTAPDSLPLHVLTEDNLASVSPDLLRAMVKTFADALRSAEADAVCNAEYRQVSDERVNHRNGYRPREWDTRTGTIELAIPKLRSGSYFPAWLLERRRRAEQALVSVVATAYLLGVSTRRWRNSHSPSASPSCRSRRSPRWPSTWTSRLPRSATGPWTPARMRSSGSTP